ncbi:hypothetical protein HanXRQr2_Chr16g0768981 [Helianthus annuus]|uniref:Uncharacterized protein n=1 Tax=Helianthus annuus TaxID=4232 RepID=A0A9K3H0C8_HELAN|nr:hypothetical protein HanXRQr2_Chr16g0768981 [Helianthus annuus]
MPSAGRSVGPRAPTHQPEGSRPFVMVMRASTPRPEVPCQLLQGLLRFMYLVALLLRKRNENL